MILLHCYEWECENNPLFLFAELSLQFGYFPDAERIPACRPFYSSGSTHSPARPVLPVWPPSDVQKLIWLIPCTNPNQQFQFRRYIYPADEPIRRKIGRDKFEPFPAQDFTVLSTFNGDVFAIFEENTGLLCRMYNIARNRAKINMEISKVRKMKPEEVGECPVAQPITQDNLRILYVWEAWSFTSRPLTQIIRIKKKRKWHCLWWNIGSKCYMWLLFIFKSQCIMVLKVSIFGQCPSHYFRKRMNKFFYSFHSK